MKVKKLEKKIWDVEGFSIIICHPDGSNVHGAMEVAQPYPYQNAGWNDWTIAHWRENRFLKNLPQFTVKVLDGDGNVVEHGLTRLGTVRDSYEEE